MATITRGPSPASNTVASPRSTSAAERGARSGPLLVATDGSESADPALITAGLLNQHLDGPVEVVTVLEPTPIYLPPSEMLALPPQFDAEPVDHLRRQVRQQVKRIITARPEWPLDVQVGDPAATVARVARDREASLVLSGISRHNLVDRVFSQETAAHIANQIEVPLLAVTAGMRALPRTVLIAIDLDSPPISVSPAIRTLLSDVSTVYAVNVKPPSASVDRFHVPSWDWAYDDVIEESRDRVLGSLDLPARASQQLVTLTGNPAKEILSFADYAKVDLIVVGQRRRSLLHRRFRTGLPTQLLRATTCPVLVLPRPRAVELSPASATMPTHTETIDDRGAWAAWLADISRRHEHRPVTLEIDDPELGAQAQVSGYTFVGAAYDRNDDRISIMLGTRRGGGAHLTHSIGQPTSIDALEGTNHRLLVLRIKTATGQALLSFGP